jgi:hypothetical protein
LWARGGAPPPPRVEVPTQWRPGKPRFFGPVRVVRYEPN